MPASGRFLLGTIVMAPLTGRFPEDMAKMGRFAADRTAAMA